MSSRRFDPNRGLRFRFVSTHAEAVCDDEAGALDSPTLRPNRYESANSRFTGDSMTPARAGGTRRPNRMSQAKVANEVRARR